MPFDIEADLSYTIQSPKDWLKLGTRAAVDNHTRSARTGRGTPGAGTAAPAQTATGAGTVRRIGSIALIAVRIRLRNIDPIGVAADELIIGSRCRRNPFLLYAPVRNNLSTTIAVWMITITMKNLFALLKQLR